MRRWRALVAVAGAVLLVTLLPAAPAVAKPQRYQPGHAQKEPLVAGRSVTGSTPAAPQPVPAAGPKPVWPAPASVSVQLAAAKDRAMGLAGPSAVSGLPVTLDATGNTPAALRNLRVDSFDRNGAARAGVDGLLLRLSTTDGTAGTGQVSMSVNYAGFRTAYGGDWASRLKLRVLPECALRTPDLPGCQGRDLATRNDVRAGTASALVDAAGAGGTLVALAATASGGAGDYTATSLAPAATWSAGGNAGNFSWTYPIRVPPSVSSLAPAISLGYSSSSVDGRMASTNNQTSWLGEGFDWQPGSIERRYNACSEDMGSGANNTTKTGDLCWDTDNATLSLAGHTGELIKDGSNPNRWHLRGDDGTLVERRTGVANGAKDGEWWVATTTDGTQYWFGGLADSNATLTVPVFGNNANEPCHQDAYKDSSCVQGYRWQLDHVVDLHGNTMTYTYAKETNRYGRNLAVKDAVSYDRAGYLAQIDYGTHTGDTGSAPMRVVFATSDRCLSNCTAHSDATAWPDVPWDQECTASPCKDTQLSPTFWTTKRLTGITTQVLNGGSYRDVERWTFSQSFPDPTDSANAGRSLWLDRISHSGGTTTVPDVTFTGIVMPNRVDTNNDQFPSMNKFRIKTITSESGGKLDLTYSAPDCVKGTRMPDQNHLESNTLRCYPVKWTPSGYANPINDFFHKYLVTDVVEAETSGSSPRMLTHYDYVGDPAWHYTDDDGLIKAANKTWSVWRGYTSVVTTVGDPGEQTRTETRFFRGMNGDHLPSGTRSVSLPAISIGGVPAAPDEDAFAGMTREVITSNGPGGAEVVATVEEPWQSAPTATRTINGSTVYARFVNTAAVHTRTALDGGRAPRTTTQRTTFDAYGMPIEQDDRGDDAVSGDEKCTLTDYARNTDLHLLDLTARVRTFAVDCGTAKGGGLTDDDVMSDKRTSYDGLAWNATPKRGDVTTSEMMTAYNGGNPTYRTESSATYDPYGRVLDSYDERGGKTTTTYNPASGGPVTGKTETNPLGWATTTTLDPAWGEPVSTADVNGRRIDISYDGLGRRTGVWLPGRDKATQSANIAFDYLVRNTAPTVVTTRKLNAAGGYVTSYQFYDNLMRERQTQASDAAGGTGAVVTDTYYDSAGRAVKTHDSYLAADQNHQPVAPSTNLFQPTETIPSQKLTVFDGAGRVTAEIFQANAAPASPGGTEKYRTTTGYGGDHIDVTPPAGGTVTSTYMDATGKAVELRQYHPGYPAGGTDPAGFDRTTYRYNRKEQLTRVQDAAGNHWDYTYDLQGHQATATDPDKGLTTTVYNDLGDLVTSTDARGVTIAYTYDLLGRKTTVRDGSVTGPKRSEWVYDTLTNGTTVDGQLAETIRYVGTDQYVKEFTGYTADYQPTGIRYTLPAGESGLAGSYSYVYTYNGDGSLASLRLPAVGDLPLETVSQGYDALQQPATLSTSLGGTYVTGTEYTSFGELGAIHLRNNSGPQADIVRTYETDTRRLAQIWTTRQTSPTTVTDLRYSYDQRGNITKIADVATGDNQCFTVDYLQRLSEAWTPGNGDCTAAPTAAALGGPAKYWQSFRYDVTGTRTSLVDHATATGDRTTTYTTPVGVHKLAQASVADNTGTSTLGYTFDPDGNMLSRPTPAAGTQTLTWDAEGHLATSQDTTGTTSYVYDVDGTRLISKDPTGKTLFLPGQELRVTTSGTKVGTRYYNQAGQTVATRTAAGLTWLSVDHQGTALVSIAAVGQAVAIRREKPFGEPRGTTGSWPSTMDKGFVGGTLDNTGLTLLGAREYDPLIGRFISADRYKVFNDPQQLQEYGYAGNNPVTGSDADGNCWSWVQWACDAGKAVAHGVSSAWHATTSWFSSAWSAVSSWFSSAWHWVTKAASAVWSTTKKVVSSAWHATKKTASGAWNWTKKAASSTWHWAKTSGWNGLKTGVRKAWQGTRLVINAPLTLATTVIATIGGGDCGFSGQELMVVCQNAPSWMYNRHGTTVGSTYLTGSDIPTTRELAHEAKHADQWAIFQLVDGPAGMVIFPVDYFIAEKVSGGGSCNPFEKWAGLKDGNYPPC